MILHPRTPVVVGSVLVLVIIRELMVRSPMPGELSTIHAQLHTRRSIDSCSSCHDPAGGLAAGCLSCHEEIAEQLESAHGFHHYLLAGKEPSCDGCHVEHAGQHFPLITETSWGAQVEGAFKHPHSADFLDGQHKHLECSSCHGEHLVDRFSLPRFPQHKRETSFLGVGKDCIMCHVDVHAGGLAADCGSCHGQDAFDPPAHFDHGEHFPLVGGHETLECSECHRIPPPGTATAAAPFPFADTRGTVCADCHREPHRTRFADECATCHEVEFPFWTDAVASMSIEQHELTGFPLEAPHAAVLCEGCHPGDLPYDERHPDPKNPAYDRRPENCAGCHEDVHAGQFAGRYDRCLDCHEPHGFRPVRFGFDRHALLYPLTGAHRATTCSGCHHDDPVTGVRVFSGTSHTCKDCHRDPHGGQFDELATEDCTTCHEDSAATFAIRPFSHAQRTSYPLEGAHSRTTCESCHVRTLFANGPLASPVRRYRDTPQECAECHVDVHRGQFAADGNVACSGCHGSFFTWSAERFNHDTQSRFPLEGAHREVACSDCHRRITVEDGTELIHFKPMGMQCRDCHDIVPQSPNR